MLNMEKPTSRALENLYPWYPGYKTIRHLVRQSRFGITKLDREDAQTKPSLKKDNISCVKNHHTMYG